jgi:dTDP-L-rhamnose 4-epimerase
MVNIGSGQPIPIKDIAATIARLLKKPGLIDINQQFRKNDIRHCYADITLAKELLGWQPKISLKKGLEELIAWSETQKAEDKFTSAQSELKQKGLI